MCAIDLYAPSKNSFKRIETFLQSITTLTTTRTPTTTTTTFKLIDCDARSENTNRQSKYNKELLLKTSRLCEASYVWSFCFRSLNDNDNKNYTHLTVTGVFPTGEIPTGNILTGDYPTWWNPHTTFPTRWNPHKGEIPTQKAVTPIHEPVYWYTLQYLEILFYSISIG